MSRLSQFGLVSLLSLSTLSQIAAYADGAGACFDNPTDLNSFITNHMQPICSPTKSQFRLYTNPLQVTNTMVTGCKYTISLCGPKSFKGFIVYAQSDTMTPSRIGSWTSPSYTPSQLMSCAGNPSGTITHTNSANKMRADFMFKTPNYVEGMGRNATVTIQARIVVSLSEWYITSITLSYLNIPNLNGGMCSDPATLPLSVCPVQGILDTSGCLATTPTPATNMSGMTGMTGMDSGMDMSSDSMSMSMSMSMSTVFTNTWQGIQLVFPGFTLNSTGTYIGALIVCFIVAFSVELVQWIQYRLDTYLIDDCDTENRTSSHSDSKQMNLYREQQELSSRVFTACQQTSRSFFHILRVFLSIFLMIIWMTLNVGLVISALVGSFIGFFTFSERRQHVVSEEVIYQTSLEQIKPSFVEMETEEKCCA